MNGEPASPSAPAPFNVLEQWPQVATIVTGATVVLSVLYDWSYFAVVDPAAMQLFTMSDHIAPALRFRPASILSSVIMYILLVMPGIVLRTPPSPPLLRQIDKGVIIRKSDNDR